MPGPKYPNAQTEAGWFDIILSGLGDRLHRGDTWSWWLSAARDCITEGHAQLITSRDSTVVYMLRCWLSPPQPCTVGQHAKYESGNAVLLHWILQPDDIPHLHNHPWDFTTRILAGGYVQERAALGRVAVETFQPGAVEWLGHDGGFHRIASHLAGNGDPSTGHGGTWSLVTTGPRVQPWSFLIDGHAVDAEAFLRTKRDQEISQAIAEGRHYQ